MQRGSFGRHRGMGSASDSTRRLAVRVKNVLLILLALALIVSLIMGIPSLRYRSDAKEYIISRMEVECGDARYYLSKLSNTGGSSTYAQLARIRSEIYAMQVLNQTYAAMEGSGSKTLVDDAIFSNLFSLVETYYNQLITSSTNTSSVLTDMGTTLTELQTALDAL